MNRKDRNRVLVTGGSGGIGSACVRAFVREGCRVAFTYYKGKEAAMALSRETGAHPICADLSVSEAATAAVREAVTVLGGLDVLVNNAGISRFRLFTDITDDEWREMMGVNLDGAFYTCREAARHMIAGQYGRIVNIGSMWGKVGASCEVHYSTAKAGLEGLTKAIAKELGLSGVTVNAIEPGLIDTPMNAALDEATLHEICDNTPVGRIGTPEDVASAVLWFASEESGFVTGQILGVDGGYAI